MRAYYYPCYYICICKVGIAKIINVVSTLLCRIKHWTKQGYDRCWIWHLILIPSGYNENFIIFDISRVLWVFDNILLFYIFCFWYHLGLYTMQEPYYLRKITLASIWLKTDRIDPINNLAIQKILTLLRYSPNINIQQVLQIFIPMSKFFDTIINPDFWYSCIHLYTSSTLILANVVAPHDKKNSSTNNLPKIKESFSWTRWHSYYV